MKFNNKLLSIVIPTRNREFYCIETIKNIISYDFPYFELVINDNSDSKKIQEFLKDLNDSRINYNYIPDRISSSKNMDIALAMATGEYVIMIGDDDTILPNIFNVVLWAKNNSIDNITPITQVKYTWPNPYTCKNGYVSWNNVVKGYKTIDAKRQLSFLLKNGVINYSSFHLPKVYHGIIKRDILILIKQTLGSYICGLSPDICLAVSSALYCEKCVLWGEPFTIAGACPKSSTSESQQGGHRGDLKDAPHLWGMQDYEWDLLIPPVYSVETIWAESAVKTLKMCQYNVDGLLNQGALIAGIIGNNITIYKLILRSLNKVKYTQHKVIVFNECILFGVKKLIERLCRKIKSDKSTHYFDVSDIDTAVRIYNQSIK
ncbi:MAG: glycosyltransferase [Bacteroidales bacterium]|nr:glycosyltransferase [Bacteroidales bacterium]